MATFDGSSFGDLTYTVDFSNDDAVAKLSELLALLKTLGIDAAVQQRVLAQFFAALGSDATTTSKPLQEVADTLDKLRSTLKADKSLSPTSQNALTKAAQSLLLGNTNAASTDPLRQAMFDQFKEGNTRFPPPGSGPRWLTGLKNLGMVNLAIQRLGRSMRHLVEENAKATREMYLMAQQAQATVSEIAKMGGALEAYGGNKGQAANELRTYEQEMAKMRRGQGTGGKYMEAARLYGVSFKPNDFEAQQREWVRYLSNPNVSKTDKVGFASIMGFDGAQVSRYSRGMEEFERENALQADLSVNAEEAAKATDEYKRSLQHLTAAWTDFKNGVLTPTMKFLTPIIEMMTELVKVIRDNAILKALVGLGLLFFAFTSLLLPLAKLLALFNMAGIGIGGLSAALKVFRGALASTATAARDAAAKMGFGGVGGIGKGIAAGAAIYGAVKSYEAYSEKGKASGNKEVAKTIGTTIGSFGGWKAGAALGAKVGTALGPWGRLIGGGLGALGGWFLGNWVGDKAGDSVNRAFNVNDRAQLPNPYGIDASVMGMDPAMMSYLHNGGTTNNSRVDIGKIDINVDGGGADPMEIAEATRARMLEEMRGVVINMRSSARA